VVNPARTAEASVRVYPDNIPDNALTSVHPAPSDIPSRKAGEAMVAGGDEAKRAFAAMMKKGKIDIAAIEAARRG
jgi:predicted 3-demethylubiquinone-9 3-methyltransferase (glyoxalase superfamily)